MGGRLESPIRQKPATFRARGVCWIFAGKLSSDIALGVVHKFLGGETPTRIYEDLGTHTPDPDPPAGTHCCPQEAPFVDQTILETHGTDERQPGDIEWVLFINDECSRMR